MPRLLLLIWLTITCSTCLANYDFNENCRTAYSKIYALHFRDAQKLIDLEKSRFPENLIPTLLESHLDFYRAFIGEEEADFNRFESNADKRLDLINDIGDRSSPYHRYVKAEIILHSAFLNAKYKNFMSAAWSVRKSYKLLSKNAELYPDFPLTYKNLGFLHAALGSVPDKYRWLLRTIGMEGHVSQGVDELKKGLAMIDADDNFKEFKPETLSILLSVLQRLEFNIDEADKIISDFDTDQNHIMVNFFVADYYLNTNRNDLADIILKKTSQSKDQFPLHFVSYMRGSVKLLRLDPSAYDHFKSYVDNYKGFNFVKAAYQKMAWAKLLEGDTEAYHECMRKSVESGETFTDEDKLVEKRAKNKEFPNITLLKARLLFDGGYYFRALDVLRTKRLEDYSSPKDRTELSYRFARIYDHLEQRTKAIRYYTLTYEKGKEKSWFFAANSALHLGLLYEKELRYEKARNYFKKCVDLKDHEYENSIEQKARAGLNRVEQKLK